MVLEDSDKLSDKLNDKLSDKLSDKLNKDHIASKLKEKGVVFDTNIFDFYFSLLELNYLNISYPKLENKVPREFLDDFYKNRKKQEKVENANYYIEYPSLDFFYDLFLNVFYIDYKNKIDLLKNIKEKLEKKELFYFEYQMNNLLESIDFIKFLCLFFNCINLDSIIISDKLDYLEDFRFINFSTKSILKNYLKSKNLEYEYLVESLLVNNKNLVVIDVSKSYTKKTSDNNNLDRIFKE
jgi:hypothetical protein